MAKTAPATMSVLSWFRPNTTADLLKTWVIGSALALLGLVIGGLRFLPSVGLDEVGKGFVLISGLLISFCGLMWAVLRALRSLRDETCLLIRNDGVELLPPPPGEPQFLSWSDIGAVEVNDRETLLTVHPLAQAEGAPLAPLYIDTRFTPDLVALSRQLETTKRRALMGLIRAPR
jgi:hypothetical protein